VQIETAAREQAAAASAFTGPQSLGRGRL
jgi:hypothetical protein